MTLRSTPDGIAVLRRPEGEPREIVIGRRRGRLLDPVHPDKAEAAGEELLAELAECKIDGEHIVLGQCRECHAELLLRADLLDGQEDGMTPAERAHAVLTGLGWGISTVRLCDQCSDRYEARLARDDFEEKRSELLERSRLPRALWGLDFADMHETGPNGEDRRHTIQAARAWGQIEDPRGLTLHGGNGAGKTRLAATAAWSRLKAGRDVTWISMPVLMAEVGAAWNDEARGEAMKILRGKGALILDDFDKVNPSEWARDVIFTAIDTRVQNERGLLITTNLRPKQLEEKYGPAIASRVGGYCRVKELAGPDYRMALNT
jgi:DNA replication protein DnaC